MSPGALDFETAVLSLGRPGEFPERPKLESSPRLAALRRAGTRHVYADSADPDELGGLLGCGDESVVEEIDGNTANQPLVAQVAESQLERVDVASWMKQLREHAPESEPSALVPWLYGILCGRIANDIVRRFSSSRVWDTSIQLHMALSDHPDTAREVGRTLRGMVPTAFVKVPFAPQSPACFLVARDLEEKGIAVNFTSTFSARQAVAAALLADVSRTNIFMGRLGQAFETDLLGEQVDLGAQRALRELRQKQGTKTQLIVASMREARSFERVAGCDVFTAPCKVIAEFLESSDVDPGRIESRLETSYEDDLETPERVRRVVGPERLASLWRVDDDFLEFLTTFGQSDEYRSLQDGDALAKRFEKAGFGDFFHAPDAEEERLLRHGKLPDLEARPVKELAPDTLMTLHADADFRKHQEAIDALIRWRM